MVNNNNFIPKENIAKIEEVREIEEKELIMPEEQAKVVDYFRERQGLISKKSKLSPSARSKVIKKYGDDYLSERAFDYDIALMQMYGPGFWSDLGEGLLEVGKFTTKVAVSTVAAGAVISTGGLAAPAIGGALWATGEWAKSELKGQEGDGADFARFLADTVSMSGSGSVFGSALGTSSQSSASKISKSAFDAGTKTGSAALIKTWAYTKMAQEGYDLAGKGKNAVEGFCHYYHGKHKSRGVSYDSECPICGGHFDKFFYL